MHARNTTDSIVMITHESRLMVFDALRCRIEPHVTSTGVCKGSVPHLYRMSITGLVPKLTISVVVRARCIVLKFRCTPSLKSNAVIMSITEDMVHTKSLKFELRAMRLTS